MCIKNIHIMGNTNTGTSGGGKVQQHINIFKHIQDILETGTKNVQKTSDTIIQPILRPMNDVIEKNILVPIKDTISIPSKVVDQVINTSKSFIQSLGFKANISSLVYLITFFICLLQVLLFYQVKYLFQSFLVSYILSHHQ